MILICFLNLGCIFLFVICSCLGWYRFFFGFEKSGLWSLKLIYIYLSANFVWSFIRFVWEGGKGMKGVCLRMKRESNSLPWPQSRSLAYSASWTLMSHWCLGRYQCHHCQSRGILCMKVVEMSSTTTLRQWQRKLGGQIEEIQRKKKHKFDPFIVLMLLSDVWYCLLTLFFFMLKKLGCHRWLERYHQCYFTISDGREGTWLNGKIQKITKKINNKNEKKSKPLI